MIDTGLTTILLAAGQGIRIAGKTDEPKVLLDLHGRSLLERHFEAWAVSGISHAVLVVGYEQHLIRDAVAAIDPPLKITWVDNPDYATKGNTHSMLLGLRLAPAGAVVIDADLVYEPDILKRCLEREDDVILVGMGSIDDIECAKALVDENDHVRMTIDKRAVTEEELEQFRFVGEAIGILKFGPPTRERLVDETEAFLKEPRNVMLNWEHLLNQFLTKHTVVCHYEESDLWVEIDTPEDYQMAIEKFVPQQADDWKNPPS